MGLLDSLTEETIDVRAYVRTLRPGHKLNPVKADNGVVYEVISPEGGHRFISHDSIASIKGGIYIPVWEPVRPTKPRARTLGQKQKQPVQKTRRKNKKQTIQKTRRKRRA